MQVQNNYTATYSYLIQLRIKSSCLILSMYFVMWIIFLWHCRCTKGIEGSWRGKSNWNPRSRPQRPFRPSAACGLLWPQRRWHYLSMGDVWGYEEYTYIYYWFPIRMSHEYTTIESGLGIIKTRLIFRCGLVQVLRRMQDHVVWKLLDELAEAGRWFHLMIPIMSYITILTLIRVHTYL